MKKNILLSVFLLALCGCQCKQQQTQTGFLNSYSRLLQGDSMTFSHEPSPTSLRQYTKFIIDPVQVHSYFDSTKKSSRLNDEEITCLTDYMHNSIYTSLAGQYQIVTEPGPDVARIRVALTDMKHARVIRKLIPAAKVSGSGPGTVAMEAEIVDSKSGDQLGAFVETRVERDSYRRFRYLYGLTRPSDVKYSINKWAVNLRKNIDIAQGYIQPCPAQ
jgi:hypothetical protein